MYQNLIKPFFDFICSFLGLVVLSPIFLLVWIGLTIANNGKPFFYQRRPGKEERIFTIIKFKTMNDKRDAKGQLLPDAKRLTPVGSFVRKTSLDELPQLLNVLKGDMSFVGPRPLLPEYVPIYDDQQRKRHLVKPGITGLAQVRGRNVMKFSERLKNDVEYVEKISIGLDLKILWWTIQTVLFQRSSVILGQTVDEIDDIGLSKNLSSNHFKEK
ncbi:MAG: lipid carrier--UDP-N-acetylgalactosaminyltransferase [Aequorivita sp.]|nr:lipid carrier--UDP-N-acetylgalactosaminyltransferase [Aequorivita sp.]MBF30636.1 lipid carrier--UDP-N-acetylgalactosaminyltransferase [Aequorivita sp.]